MFITKRMSKIIHLQVSIFIFLLKTQTTLMGQEVRIIRHGLILPSMMRQGYIGNSQPAYPRITTDGIKGDGLYATDPAMIGLNTVTFNWSGQTAGVFDNVQSYTVLRLA